jgi:hypothetical protein
MEQIRSGPFDDASVPASSLSRVGPNEIVVLYKQSGLMAVGLDFATTLVQELSVPFRLLEMRVVPHGIPLDIPARRTRLENNLRRIAKKSAVPIRTDVILARNWEQGIRRALRSRSVVLIPIQESSRTRQDKRMAERMRKCGHQVIWLGSE